MSGRRRVPAAVRLARADELEVEIERLVAGGDGLARFAGIPVFVPRSAPGDRLRVRLTERRPDYGRAEIVQVLTPGAGRREPPCPYYSRCGGCDLQHLDDDLQVTLKAAAFRETLERIGRIELPEAPHLVGGEAWGYRLRTRLHLERRAGAVAAGYFARGSHELVAVERCPILLPELERVLPGLASLDEPLPRRLDLAVGDGGRLSTAPVVAGLPHGELELTVGEHTYRFDARCFFQAHRRLVGELVARVVGEWRGALACDLYAGVGLFALPLARRYARVIAVDGDRIAARYAAKNARAHRLGGVEVVPRAVESWIRELPADCDRVVVDPPRAGLSATVKEVLARFRPRRLTYVSCHPATLARDLRELVAHYSIEEVALLDLFPQTGHLEAVVQLAGRSDGGIGPGVPGREGGRRKR